MFEKETLELYQGLKKESEKNKGLWSHSPVEDWKVDYFESNLNEFNLRNFRRTPLADGMISFPDRPLRCKPILLTKPWLSGIPFWQKIRGVRDILKELYQMSHYVKFNLKELNDNLVGNPCYYRLGKSKITDFSIRMCFYGKYIEKEFLNSKNMNILEVGGGFGGLCLKLLSSEKLNIRNYFLVELPEIMTLAYWYFKNSGCEVVTFISENDYTNITQDDQKTAVLLAPWLLPKMNTNFDLFINTMSFQHMNQDNLDFYFSQIERLKVKNLYLVNRDSKRDPTDVKISDYPIPSEYRLVKEGKYPFSGHKMRLYAI